MFAVEVSLVCIMWASTVTRPYARRLTLLILTVLTVEFCEGLSWPYVLDMSNRMANAVQCPLPNIILTTIATVAVFLQPLLACRFAMCAPLGAVHPHKAELRLLLILSAIFFFSACTSFVLTMSTHEEDRVYQVDGRGAVAFPRGWSYATTCAYKGPHGHQLWQWAFGNRFSDVLPNTFTYNVNLLIAILLVYDKIEAIALTLFFSLYITMVFAWNGGEAGSTWCFSGILCFVFYVVFPHLKVYFGIPAVTSWSEMLPYQKARFPDKVVDGSKREVSAVDLRQVTDASV